MTSLFWYLALLEYASVHNEVMQLRNSEAVVEFLRNKTQGQNSVNLSISSDKQYAL
jgi:hypothetical protein